MATRGASSRVTEPKDWLRPARKSTPSLCLFVFLPRKRGRETLIFKVIIKKSCLVALPPAKKKTKDWLCSAPNSRPSLCFFIKICKIFHTFIAPQFNAIIQVGNVIPKLKSVKVIFLILPTRPFFRLQSELPSLS